ncbi:O-acetyltransferase OatA [compost metagenome]
MTYIKGLDGLRALAALSVILFHLDTPGFALGWTGVPLFFVISGFLITGILLDLRAASPGIGDFLRTFYIRRTLRIFPLYYAYLGIACALALATHSVIPDLWSYVLYLQNYTLGASRFEHPWVLGHTWSLAVEEQFYLIWPFVVWLAGRRFLPAVIVATIAMSIVARMAISHFTGNPFLQFATLLSCADGLVMGAALSLAHRAGLLQARAVPFFLAAAALMALSLGIVGYGNMWTPLGWATGKLGDWFFSILCLFFTALLGLLVRSQGLQNVLEWQPLRALGKISYGLYIYHGLILIVVDRLIHYHTAPHTTSLWLLRAGTVLVGTIITSWLSFRYFENPLLRYKDVLARSRAQPQTDVEAA